jgi:hypothetical protein
LTPTADAQTLLCMKLDPVDTNPAQYSVVFENERVRVLQYLDAPGHRTTLHEHPDSVMVTLSGFRRRLHAADGQTRDVEIPAGMTSWLPAQQHAGENTGETETRVIFVELKGDGAASQTGGLGPATD